MAKIQVPADLMVEVARRIRVGKDQLKYILEQNFSRTTALLNEFEGETARRFRSLHEENTKALSLVPVNLQKAADELETIVNRFVDADSGIVHIPDFFNPNFGTFGSVNINFNQLNELSDARNVSIERPPREEQEKGLGDHVHDFFEGAWKPLSTLDDNIVKLGEQIEEDPVGTIGGMARDAIAAPVEGAVSGATFGWNFLWGTGDAREQAKEHVETEKQKFEEQGAAFYAGTAASALAVQFLERRIGIKGKLGDGVKYTPREEDQDKLKDKVSEGTHKVQTGGRELSVDEYLRRLDKADEMYESFRKSNFDVQFISENTGMEEHRIRKIKEHVFFKEHIKEHGVGRFEADYEIAQAWDRLQKGTYKQNDIDLLNHELFESKFEGIFKTDYRTAHDRTVDSGRPWYPPEEE
ncbi:WXG100 family type VII secretion target [Paenibacillus sp. P96]|uniref:WXG100 family type VII secretion target n=1 Tax=Paenibacillus zeirhizosphaerae TaxID=2987519 RepID=A0ABT9FRJ0_9BACL|nr:WXG100 family type VII secretion target [Paenibacillus sp. P96]MDP4097351.1 WXG100 family type VII secretion target [Paenibacillus sp. P96]